MEALAELFGFGGLFGWQRRLVDVALELDEDGFPAFRTVIVNVARQQGKTVVLFLVIMARILQHLGSPVHVVYQAQTVEAGRDVWSQKLFPRLRASPLAARLGVRVQDAGAHVGMRCSEGSLRVLSGSDIAGQGTTLGLVVLDEAHTYRDDGRERALLPTMVTDRHAQMWVVSVAGSDSSDWWWEQVELGRRAVREGWTERVCYVEYGMADEDDPYDEALWPDWMPSLVDGGMDVEVVRDMAAKMSQEAFCQMVANKFIRGHSGELVFDEEAWLGVVSDRAEPRGGVWLGLGAAHDSSTASVVACGGGVVAVVHARGRTDWVEDRVRHFWQRNPDRLRGVVTLGGGPLKPMVERLRDEGLLGVLVSPAQFVEASGVFNAAVWEGNVTVRHHAVWERSLRSTVIRQSGSGIRFSGERGAEIGPVQAAALAFWADGGALASVGTFVADVSEDDLRQWREANPEAG